MEKDDDRKSGAGFKSLVRTGRLIYRVCAVLVLLLLGGVAYVTIFGFPASIVDGYVEDFNAREQIGLAVGRVAFFPPDTIRVYDVRVEGARIDSRPVFESDDCWAKIDWKAFPKPMEMLSAIYIGDGSVCLRIHEEDSGFEVRSLRFDEIDARILKEDRSWIVKNFTARLGVGDITAKGVYHTAPETKDEEGAGLRKYAQTRFVMNELREMDSYQTLQRWQKDYEGWSFAGRAGIDVEFEIFSGERERDIVRVAADADRMRLRGEDLEDVRFEGQLDGRELSASHISFSADGDKALADFSYDLDSKQMDMRITSNLDGKSVKRLAPTFVSNRMKSLQLDVDGALEFACRLGPAPLAEIEQRIDVEFQATDIAYREMLIDSVSAIVNRDSDAVEASDVEVGLGDGEISGAVSYNTESKAFRGEGRANIDPHNLVPFIGSERLREIMRSFEIGDDLVKFEGLVGGVMGAENGIEVDGVLEGRDFLYNGTGYQHFKSGVTYGNRLLIFDDFLLQRPEGSASGRIELDMKAETVDINAVSGCSPQSIVSIIDTGLVARVELFDFDGPVQVSADGVVDYGEFKTSDLQASVAGRNVGLHGFSAQRANFNLHLLGNRMEFRGIEAQGFGGTLQGEIDLDLNSKASNPWYDYSARIEVDDAELAQLVVHLRKIRRKKEEARKDIELYEGVIAMDLTVDGVYSNGTHRIESGKYRVEIEDGKLFRIPLLGGLSYYLSKLLPGFGYLSQTELESHGLIRPDRVLIQDVQLQGGVVSVKGHGDYFFNHDVKVDVQVVPLRKGITASIIRLVTFPVSWLFEFTLTGTVDDPEWKPKNLPKQLFLKFD